MKFDKHIHTPIHVIKSIIGAIIKPFDFFSPNQLIVLNYHGTQKKFISNFENQLDYLAKSYRFISPVDFFKMLDNEKEVKGKHILLTFDDGIKNNINIIPLLNKKGISACFFVVPNFIDSTRQKDYFIKNIRPTINPVIDSVNEDFEAMSWQDLKVISKTNLIGCHTLSHTMIKDVLSDEALSQELILSKQKIEAQLKISIDTFCSINNTALTIGKKEFEFLSKTYIYHFSTFGGNNLLDKNPLIIKRINVESHWLMGAFKFALSSFEFYRWKKAIVLFEKTVSIKS